MEDLYKVIEIKDKGLGCVALKDLKKGTLILREKPQCVGVTSGHSGLKYIKNAEIFKIELQAFSTSKVTSNIIFSEFSPL